MDVGRTVHNVGFSVCTVTRGVDVQCIIALSVATRSEVVLSALPAILAVLTCSAEMGVFRWGRR